MQPTNTTSLRSANRGFTLIELAIVMTIVSLLAAALSFRLLGPWTSAMIHSDLERIQAIDDFARRTSISASLPHVLEIDQDEHLIQLVLGTGNEKRVIRRCRLSSLSRFGKVRIDNRQPATKTDNHEVTVSGIGSSPSYAVQVITENQKKWLLIVGQTGQVFKLEQEREIDEYFSMLQ